jgi:hypothetical protein
MAPSSEGRVKLRAVNLCGMGTYHLHKHPAVFLRDPAPATLRQLISKYRNVLLEPESPRHEEARFSGAFLKWYIPTTASVRLYSGTFSGEHGKLVAFIFQIQQPANHAP